jgi:membrane-bound lytic murein transglycosylase D
LERRGLPSELAFIPIVESTYNPNAVSPAAISTGMWQFVASSGKRFGLIQDATIDERKDIVKSTKAAVTYLQYLDDLFGSWDLAIAAYNWGEGNISNALNQANSRNFYDLKLRSVTRQYLPKVIALANIVQNPQKFGIKLINLPNQPYFSVITPTKTTKVSDFISQYQLSEDLNKRLNPQYNSLSYSVNTNQRLLLPMQLNKPVANLTPNLVSANSSIPESVVINILTNQEKITAVNKPTSSAVKTLPNKQVTTVDPTSNINPAIKDLLINTIPTTSLTTTNSEAETTHYQNYTVSAGDTLYSIAKKFTVSVDLIKQDNKLGDNNLQTNQILKIRQ